MSQAEIGRALAIARERHTAIAEGDLDLYASLDGALAEACASLVSGGATSLTAADIPPLDELIALETQSRRLLETLMSEASERLDSLRKTGRANGAYMRHEHFSVNGA